MLKVSRSEQERLEALFDQSEARFVRVINEAVAIAKDDKTLTELVALLEAGLIEQAADEAARIIADAINEEYENSFIGSGKATSAIIGGAIGALIGFKVGELSASTILISARVRIEDEYREAQRRATREAMRQAQARGLSIKQAAKEYVNSVGLTERQIKAVDNYRRLLERQSAEALRRDLRDRRFDPTVQRAVDDKEPLTKTQINRMVDRYRAKALRSRTKTISRTEALTSINEANNEAYRQAIENGFLEPEQIRREWITRLDPAVRDSHLPLHGEVRNFNQVFETFLGPLRFPGDPLGTAANVINCRCALAITIRGAG